MTKKYLRKKYSIFKIHKKVLKLYISNWCERYLNRYPSELIKLSEIIEGKFSHDSFSFKAKIKRIIESILALLL